MIYCVRFADVESILRKDGWSLVSTIADHHVFKRVDVYLTIPAPNVDGNLPEMLFHDAFYSQDIEIPDLMNFWCD